MTPPIQPRRKLSKLVVAAGLAMAVCASAAEPPAGPTVLKVCMGRY
jgi:hypothetical protein